MREYDDWVRASDRVQGQVAVTIAVMPRVILIGDLSALFRREFVLAVVYNRLSIANRVRLSGYQTSAVRSPASKVRTDLPSPFFGEAAEIQEA